MPFTPASRSYAVQLLPPGAPQAPMLSANSLSLSNSGVVTFAASASVPSGPTTAPVVQFPAPWSQVSGVPGIRIIIHNFSVTTPVQPTLLNADNSIFFAGMSLVEPGGGQSSWGLTNETVPGMPGSALKLALKNIVVGDAAGFGVEVQAWAV